MIRFFFVVGVVVVGVVVGVDIENEDAEIVMCTSQISTV